MTILIAALINSISLAQTKADTTSSKELKEVTVKSWMRRDINRLPEQENGFLSRLS